MPDASQKNIKPPSRMYPCLSRGSSQMLINLELSETHSQGQGSTAGVSARARFGHCEWQTKHLQPPRAESTENPSHTHLEPQWPSCCSDLLSPLGADWSIDCEKKGHILRRASLIVDRCNWICARPLKTLCVVVCRPGKIKQAYSSMFLPFHQ